MPSDDENSAVHVLNVVRKCFQISRKPCPVCLFAKNPGAIRGICSSYIAVRPSRVFAALDHHLNNSEACFYTAHVKYRANVLIRVLPIHVRSSNLIFGKLSVSSSASWSARRFTKCLSNRRAMRSEIDGMHMSCRIHTVSSLRSLWDLGCIPDGMPGGPPASFSPSCLMTSAVSSMHAVRIRCEAGLNSALRRAPSKVS